MRSELALSRRQLAATPYHYLWVQLRGWLRLSFWRPAGQPRVWRKVHDTLHASCMPVQELGVLLVARAVTSGELELWETRCTPACPLYLPILPLQGCRGSGGTLGPVQCACVCGEEASSFGTVCCTTHQGRCISGKCSLCAAPHKDTELACGCLELHTAQCCVCVGGDVRGQAGEPSTPSTFTLSPGEVVAHEHHVSIWEGWFSKLRLFASKEPHFGRPVVLARRGLLPWLGGWRRAGAPSLCHFCCCQLQCVGLAQQATTTNTRGESPLRVFRGV